MFTKSQIQAKLDKLTDEKGEKIVKICYSSDANPFFLTVNKLTTNAEYVQKNQNKITDIDKIENLIYYGFPSIMKDLEQYHEYLSMLKLKLSSNFNADQELIDKDFAKLKDAICNQVSSTLDSIKAEIKNKLQGRNCLNIKFIDESMALITEKREFLTLNHSEFDQKILLLAVERVLDPSIEKLDSIKKLQESLQKYIQKNTLYENQIYENLRYQKVASFIKENHPWENIYSKYTSFDLFPNSEILQQITNHMNHFCNSIQSSFVPIDTKCFAEPSIPFKINEFENGGNIQNLLEGDSYSQKLAKQTLKKLNFLSENDLINFSPRSNECIDLISFNLHEQKPFVQQIGGLIQRVFQHIKQLQIIQIDLRGNALDDLNLNSIIEGLKCHENCLSLKLLLSSNNFSQHSIKNLIDLTKSMKYLRYLFIDLKNLKIEDSLFPSLETLISSAQKLEELHLHLLGTRMSRKKMILFKTYCKSYKGKIKTKILIQHNSPLKQQIN